MTLILYPESMFVKQIFPTFHIFFYGFISFSGYSLSSNLVSHRKMNPCFPLQAALNKHSMLPVYVLKLSFYPPCQILYDLAGNNQSHHRRNKGVAPRNLPALCTFSCSPRRTDTIGPAANRHIFRRFQKPPPGPPADAAYSPFQVIIPFSKTDLTSLASRIQ